MNWKIALLNSNPCFGGVCVSSELPPCSAVQLFKCFTTDHVMKNTASDFVLVLFWGFSIADKYFCFINKTVSTVPVFHF